MGLTISHTSIRALSDETWVHPAPVWSAVRTGTVEDLAYGYGYLHKLNNSQIHFQYRQWYTGEVWDEIWLIRE